MIKCRDAVLDDMKEVADVHMRNFPDYFLMQLGRNLLSAYYLAYFKGSSPFIIAEDEKNEIVGFCLGYYDNTFIARQNFIRENIVQLTIKMVWLNCCLSRLAINRTKECISKVLRKKVKMSVKNINVNSMCGGGYIINMC